MGEHVGLGRSLEDELNAAVEKGDAVRREYEHICVRAIEEGRPHFLETITRVTGYNPSLAFLLREFNGLIIQGKVEQALVLRTEYKAAWEINENTARRGYDNLIRSFAFKTIDILKAAMIVQDPASKTQFSQQAVQEAYQRANRKDLGTQKEHEALVTKIYEVTGIPFDPNTPRRPHLRLSVSIPFELKETPEELKE